MPEKDSHWIGGAIKKPGRLRAAAARAHEPVSTYAREHEHDPAGTIGDAARLFTNVLHPINQAHHPSPGHKPKGERGPSDGKGHYSGH